MKITVAATAGFCMGVRRAVDMALKAAASSEQTVYSIGPLIHNERVVEMLAGKGISVAQDTERLPKGSTVIIRAHGLPPADENQLRAQGLKIIDATCPLVKKIHHIIEQEAAEGRFVLVAGDAGHAEVKGLMGRAEAGVKVISSLEQTKTFNTGSPLAMVAQSTFSHSLYNKMSEVLSHNFPDCRIHDTICLATEERQKEVLELAGSCGAIVVAGGRNSANTRRLAEVAAEKCDRVFHVEQSSELSARNFAGIEHTGVTAGASTPEWVINEITESLKGF